MIVNSFLDILLAHIERTESRLCVGLDIDADRLTSISSPTTKDLRDFARTVIDATWDYVAAYKINFAFFERYGSEGFKWLEDLMRQIGQGRLTIADAKRGDIYNSSRHYASAIFDHFGFSAATVNPYMGRDSLAPFMEDHEKGAFVICLTSNDGASDLQLQPVGNGVLYQKVIDLVKLMNDRRNCGLVVGATRSEELTAVRRAAGDMPLLIPGVGAQEGDLQTSVREGNRGGIALINVSRAILYAGDQSEMSIRETAEFYWSEINAAMDELADPGKSEYEQDT